MAKINVFGDKNYHGGKKIVSKIGTVLRTVLTDFKNKHDLGICDLRNVQNFAKII